MATKKSSSKSSKKSSSKSRGVARSTAGEPLSPAATRLRNTIEKNPRLRIELLAAVSRVLREYNVKISNDEFLLYTTLALVSEVGAGPTPETLG